MHDDFDLERIESAGPLSALDELSNEMSAMSAPVSIPSPVCQLGEGAFGLGENVGLTSMMYFAEEPASLSNPVNLAYDTPAGTDLVSTFASVLETNVAISDMSGLGSAATIALETSSAFSDTVNETQLAFTAEDDFSDGLVLVNETESVRDAVTDSSLVRNCAGSFATAISGLFTGASLITETLELFSDTCQAISKAVDHLVEAFANSIQSIFSRLKEYTENLAEIFQQACKKRTEALQNRLLWATYRRFTFITVGSPRKITMRNALSRRKKFIFHRKQGGESDPDSICCVNFIAVTN